MNKFKNIIYLLGLSLMIILPGCSDPADEIASIDYERLFSPTDLTARVVNITGVRLTWNANKLADSYSIEVYNNESYEGAPVKSVDKVAETTYTISDFEGDMQYWARVKAVGANIPESKWSEVSFKTDIKSILLPVEIGDVTATEYTIRWPAGESATRVTLTPVSPGTGATVSYTLTADDIASGTAIITGLQPATGYTAVLYKDSQRVGLTTLTTLAEGTIFIYPEDDFESKLSEGDTFLLMPGTYPVATLNISKSMTLQGASAGDKPVLLGTIIRPADGADVILKDLVLDGTGSTGDQTLVYPAGEFNELSIDGCEIKNYTKGALYVNNATKITSITITNCIYHEIECNGGDFIDFRNGLAETFTFRNNTIYNSALARDLFRMDAGGSTNFPDVKSIITIENNTFYKVCDGTSRRILYIRLASNEISFNKNIIAETQGYYTNQAATTIKEMSQNNYFNAPNFTASSQSNAKNDSGSYTTLDPQFKDPANGDFTVQSIDVTAGDPRWIQ
jgi:hypothetical protein